MRRVLILESDAALRGDLLRAVRGAGYLAESAAALDDAPGRLAAAAFDIVIAEIRAPEDFGALAGLHAAQPRLALVATGHSPSRDVALEAMRCGACEYLCKPFALGALEAALAAAGRAAERAASPARAPLFLTEDPGMERCLRLAEAAAATDATVQIVGESGTGKELLARFVHRAGARRDGPFVVVNCAALPEALAESELFGHERGAFTGAVEARTGQIAAAEGGTLLLDEVADLAPALQPKLLRVLQEREVQAVGSLGPRAVDVRIVATTQRELEAEVAAGRFRADLFYRLDVIVLHIPPLRERLGDVALLARHFLARFAEAAGCEPPRLPAAAQERLRAHPFRGNVRELENLMRRALVLFPGREIESERLLGVRPPADPIPPPARRFNLRELERRTIELSLAETRGNRTLASRHLGISVRTLRNKIRLYGLA